MAASRANNPARDRLIQLVLAAAFLVLLFLPGLFHLRYGLRRSDLQRWGTFLRRQPMPAAVRSIDQDFEHRFLLRFVATALTAKVPVVQSHLREEDIQTGVGDFLFATEDTQVCTAAGFLHPRFPRPAEAARQLILFDQQLKTRGIHLLVVPVPAKATIYPDRLDPHYDAKNRGPFENVDQDRWFARLNEAGVDTLDITPVLWKHRDDPEGWMFYPTDTHWTDRAKILAAKAITGHLRGPLLAGLPKAHPYELRPATHMVVGNLIAADDGKAPDTPIPEKVMQLYDADGAFEPGDDAEVALLGDSQAGLGVEAGYGLAQRLTETLGTDVQSLALIGGGPDGMRDALASKPAALQHKKLVIFVFSIRHLLIKPWDPVTIGG